MRPNEISYKVIGAAMSVHSALGPGLLESADFIVENCVVVEIKCVERLLPVHRTQLLSYLKLTKLPIGLLLNFKVAHMRDGIHRVINAPEAEL
jgi:hypothetical protein